MERKMTQQQDIDRAKITSAVSAMRTMLIAASKASHDLTASYDENDDEDYREFDRTYELGSLVDVLSNLCGPDIKVLYDVAIMLLKIHDDEEENVELKMVAN
jgi:hypothetical protein